jgi:hypothetical protein
VTVDPETDTTAEADETVVITLTAGASYNVVNPNSATGTILNDDTLVSVVVSPSSTPRVEQTWFTPSPAPGQLPVRYRLISR